MKDELFSDDSRWKQEIFMCLAAHSQYSSPVEFTRWDCWLNGRFYTSGRIIRLDELGQTFVIRLVIRLCVKTGTTRIIRPDKLSSVVRLERRTTEDSSSGRIMSLVPVFTLETNNQTNNECLPKFVQTHNASSSIKTANISARWDKWFDPSIEF